ncbi:MAG: gliding motility-associated C-terminal domain-containing protein, partial [Bacteroidales bacterium]
RLPHYYQKNVYITQHTFPGPGVYGIVVQDPNRNDGVKNIPNSVNVIFSIKTTILINPSLGDNSTPVLLNPPIDRAALGQTFIHNPAAYDPDGDSISYELTVCTEADGKPIQDYTLPASSDTLYVDPVTGDLVWRTPVETGDYNIAMNVAEWRNGVKIGNIVRDMQVTVYDTDNMAPVQTEPGNVCIQAGDSLVVVVEATDIDGNFIQMQATGGPFAVEQNPATYVQDSEADEPGYSRATFVWHTDCSHVRDQYYTVVLKAEDDHEETPLVDIRNMNIKVLGPAPQTPALIPTGNAITLSWPADSCPSVQGYRVFRKIGPSGYEADSCTGGIPEFTGYELIAGLTDRFDTLFVDDNQGEGLPQGNEYCYVIVSVYPDGSLSFPSQEACSPLVEGNPAMLQVSVEDHSTLGTIRLSWAKPDGLDTIPANGPFEYRISRSPDLLGRQMALAGVLNTADLNDTVWLDEDVNTEQFPWSYRVELYNNEVGNRFLIGGAETASSLVPEGTGGDNLVSLVMRKNVPWINSQYTIYRQDPGKAGFDSIATTTSDRYIDNGLINGEEYCYRVTSRGWRLLQGELFENVNHSHTVCVTPVDSTPPCPPPLRGFSACDSGYNHLNWAYVHDSCYEDVVSYRLFYTPGLDQSPTLLTEIEGAYDTAYNHFPEGTLAGCYLVTAVDSFGNESLPSVHLCLDQCSNYVLPNVFSPNNDGVNDLYVPLRSAYVDRVNMQIFNRWGLVVFETEDPDINWDGKHKDTGLLVAPGVYYYICDVYEQRLSGLEINALTGFIYVYSGESNDVFIEAK